MSKAPRVDAQPAFVIHATPWRETSLVVELFTRDYGRVAALAKGAKRANSAMRALQLNFQPLSVAWSGQQELRNLLRAEWQGGIAAPQGDALFCGFYLNELLLRLLTREDPHPKLFDAYGHTLNRLAEAQHGAEQAWILRCFEWQLLSDCGYAPDMRSDHRGVSIQGQADYEIRPGSAWRACSAKADASRKPPGPSRVAEHHSFEGASESLRLPGAKVLELADLLQAQNQIPSADSLQSLKAFMRILLAHPLEGRALRTRTILLDLQRIDSTESSYTN